MTTNINDWPYPEVETMFKTGDKSWREVSHKIYWDQLECVPPVRMERNCFMVGEPWHHDERGAIHTAFVQIGERYFCRMDHLVNFDPVLYRRFIYKQIETE